MSTDTPITEALRLLQPHQSGEAPVGLEERLRAHAVLLAYDGPGLDTQRAVRTALADICLAFTRPTGYAARHVFDLCVMEEDEVLVRAALEHAADDPGFTHACGGDAGAAEVARKLRNYAHVLRDLRATYKP